VLVPARDPAALRAAVERLLGDADERARLGAAARAAAAAFGSEEAGRALQEAYESAVTLGR
jgi:glycosyltransferase involved in cell wall biosynthesis